MPLILSGSVNISGSMTATTILVSSPGGGGMVSSSQQIQNYNLFAVTSSANTFYGTQTITGAIIASASNGNIRIKGSTDGFLGAGESDNKLYLTDWATAAKGLIINLSTGAATFSDNIVMGTSGKGIDFSSNANAGGMTSELLNDYEEGTWTPVIGGTTSESGQSYSGQTGYYTKIGRLVTASFRVVLSTRGTITGDVAIKGLPFTANSAIGYGAGTTLWENLAIGWSSIFIVVQANSTFATFEGVKTAGVSSTKLASADIDNNSQFNGSITYIV
jgi:hypothetical protein